VEMLFELWMKPESSITSRPDEISWASDWLLHTLTSKHPHRGFHAQCGKQNRCDSLVSVASTGGIIKDSMSPFWGSCLVNDRDYYCQGAIRRPVRLCQNRLLLGVRRMNGNNHLLRDTVRSLRLVRFAM